MASIESGTYAAPFVRPPRERLRTPLSPCSTLDESAVASAGRRIARPALALACGPEPIGRVFPIPAAGLLIGRGKACDLVVDDAKVSRQHTRVRARGGAWFVDDLDSRNGTWIDGRRLTAGWCGNPRSIRVGGCVFVTIADTGARPASAVVEHGGTIVGFALAEAWARVDAAARSGIALHLNGESGSGKEIAARRFHEATRRRGNFVPVNCAAIPSELAERILFGARRGAYSGAVADAEGVIQAADGGTLFLDEIGELPAAIQAKLLRVLECGEVTALGATRAVPVSFALVSATHRDLRADAARGTFRADLFHRIAGYTVVLPPLRERPEELALHIRSELAAMPNAPASSAEFVEACALRRWDGNVRELRAWVRRAATEARIVGSPCLRAGDLPAIESAPVPAMDPLGDPDVVDAALRRHDGNISACARGLGVHRNQLRRWLARVRPRRVP